MYYLKLAGGLLVLSLVFWGGCAVQQNRDNSKIDSLNGTIHQMQLDEQKKAQETSEWKRLTLENHLAELAKIDEKHTKELRDVEKQRDSTVADLRSANLQLRKKFTCPTGAASPASGVDDGETQYGLTREDAEFLLREAAEADKVKVQLNALIDYVDSLLKQK